jgi:hypothetical protein
MSRDKTRTACQPKGEAFWTQRLEWDCESANPDASGNFNINKESCSVEVVLNETTESIQNNLYCGYSRKAFMLKMVFKYNQCNQE